MEFRQMVIDALDRMVESDAMAKIIEEQLAKTIRTIIHSELESYSEFGKRLSEAVKASLRLNGELDLPSYNDAILKIVRTQLEKLTQDTIQSQVAKNLERLLEPAPAEITLSKLVELYIEHLKSKRSGDCVCYGHDERIALDVRDWSPGFKYVHLSEDPEKKHSSADVVIGVHNAEVFSLRFGSRDVEKEMFAGGFYGFERLLFQMKAAKTKLIFDRDPSDIDVSYALEEF